MGQAYRGTGMSRRIVNITLDNLGDMPPKCRRCVFWELGPASRALEGAPADVRAAATQSVRNVLAPLVKGDTVPLGASIWIVTARAS